MNVASLELCKRLYELSGWRDTDYGWVAYTDWETDKKSYELSKVDKKRWVAGAYDAGYLLRKLPAIIDLGKSKVRDLYLAKAPDVWIADYKYRSYRNQEWWHMYDKAGDVEADTPEDALCKLAIKLFEEDILK